MGLTCYICRSKATMKGDRISLQNAIRSRAGFNNNPNAFQFRSADKRLLIRHELREFENRNCLFDGIDILRISSRKNSIKNPIGNYSDLNFNVGADHDYDYSFWELSVYVENIVLYISGYNAYLLSNIKNGGPHITPSSDVMAICKACAQIIRKYKSELTKPKIKQFLINKIFNHIGMQFDNKVMNDHILAQDILDNHRTQL
ncbi:hypothetical protein PV325_012969, partial [Microctonus aethiopoides]